MAKESGVVFRIKATDETKQGTQSAKSSFQSFVADVDQLFNGKLSQLGKVISNPWALAGTAIAGTTKVLKELTSVGLDAQRGFEQLQIAFGDSARAVDDMLDSVDRTTLATKDDLESMAKALSQYNYGVEDLQTILQVTADIATTTGKEFGTVQSAVISALQGQSRAIEKLIPDWDSLVTEYGSVEGALQHLGGEYEQTRLKFTSGSISQTLDNMSSSWQNIKENLGQTIVMDIEASGILGVMEGWLHKIEQHTANLASKRELNERWNTINSENPSFSLQTIAGTSNIDEIINAYGKLVNLPEIAGIGSLFKTNMLGNITGWSEYGLKMAEEYKASLAPTGDTTVIEATEAQRKSFFDTMNLLGWKRYDDVTEDDFNNLLSILSLLPDAEQEQYIGTILDYYDAWNLSKNPIAEEEKPKVTVKPQVTSWQKLWTSNAGYVYNATTKKIEQQTGILIRINESRWDSLTESDFNQAINALSSIDDEATAERWASWLSDRYMKWWEYHNEPDHTGEEGWVKDAVTGKWKQSFKVGSRAQQYAYDLQFETPRLSASEHLWNSYQSGMISFDQMMETASNNNISLEGHMDEISAIEQAKEDERFDKTMKTTKDIISGLTNITGILKDGLQAEEVPSLFSSVGGMIGGKLGTIFNVIGGFMGLTMGIASLFDDSKTTTADESVQSQIAQYSGSTVVRINNYFEGSYIVGSGGMQELAMTIRDELTNLEAIAR